MFVRTAGFSGRENPSFLLSCQGCQGEKKNQQAPRGQQGVR